MQQAFWSGYLSFIPPLPGSLFFIFHPFFTFCLFFIFCLLFTFHLFHSHLSSYQSVSRLHILQSIPAFILYWHLCQYEIPHPGPQCFSDGHPENDDTDALTDTDSFEKHRQRIQHLCNRSDQTPDKYPDQKAAEKVLMEEQRK